MGNVTECAELKGDKFAKFYRTRSMQTPSSLQCLVQCPVPTTHPQDSSRAAAGETGRAPTLSLFSQFGVVGPWRAHLSTFLLPMGFGIL